MFRNVNIQSVYFVSVVLLRTRTLNTLKEITRQNIIVVSATDTDCEVIAMFRDMCCLNLCV